MDNYTLRNRNTGKINFVFTLACLPPYMLVDEQYQGLTWRFTNGHGIADWKLLHIPSIRKEFGTKDELIEFVTKIASKIWDNANL